MKKRLLRIKWENILLLFCIPLAIIQFLKASTDYRITSILLSFILYGGTYMTLQITRQEALLNNVYETEKPILKPILNMIYAFIDTKKEIIKQAIYKRPSLYILRACFK